MRRVILILCILYGAPSFCQVTLQTGSASFNLPVFNWQDNKSRLNLNINLSYNSGNGLKVNDVASVVGQGWNLIAGGVITRIPSGEPDDQKPYEGNGTSEDITKYPAGMMYDNTIAEGVPKALSRYPIYGDKNHIYKQHNNVSADKELDHFAFQFNGRSGVFVLGGENRSFDPVILGDTKLRIWYDKDESMINSGIRTTITTFYIQDENGLIYKFAQHELTKVLKTKYCNSSLSSKRTQPNFKSGGVYYESMYDEPTEIKNPWIITGWHLTQIIDPLTQNFIAFTYNVRNINTEAGISISYSGFKNYSTVSQSISISKSPRISSINFPDNHQVIFNYGAARFDMKGDLILSSVDIKYQTRYLAKYIFNTSYFVKNRYSIPSTDTEKKSARLCLLSIKKLGVDLKAEESPYHFDYYLGSSFEDDFVPPPFSHLKDIWGFYNGDQNQEVNGANISVNSSPFSMSNVQLKGLCFLRDNLSGVILNPKQGYAKNGLLKQIIYPTGGSLNYYYEQNKQIVNGQDRFVGGVHVSRTTVTDGGYSNGCDNPLVTNYKYTDSSGTYSSLWGFEMPINSTTISNYYSPEKKYFHISLFSIGCKYRFQYPGIISRDNSVALTTGQQILEILSYVSGLINSGSEIIHIINLVSTASGPGKVIMDVIANVINIILTCFIDPSRIDDIPIYYNTDLNASNSLPSQFSRVEVTENSGSSGKTVYEFTDPSDYPVWEQTNPSFSMMQRYAYWTYGLPKKTTVYDALGAMVKQVENIYDYTYAKHTEFFKFSYLYTRSYKALILKSSSQKAYNFKSDSDSWDNPDIYNNQNQSAYTIDTTSNPDMKVYSYLPYSGRALLSKSIQRVFNKQAPTQYLTTTTEYTYNDGGYPSYNYEVNEIKTTASNGDVFYKRIKYDNTLLTQHNIITTPNVTTTSFKKNNSLIEFYTGESVTEYTTLLNGNIVPFRNLVQRFTMPVPASSMGFYNYQGYPDNPNYKQIQTFIYNANSNLAGILDEGGHSVANIYDYNDKFIVASIINADPNLDKPAYTSFETNDFSRSGWTMTGTPTYNSISAITGTNSLVLSSGKSLKASLNTAKSYKLSFWASNSGITVSGNTTLIKSAPTLNGFTYYEYSIAQGTSMLTLSGNSNIDELRLYPQNARMRTITYDPLIGKTSECDENNRITYYEYDEMGRLQFIKDENKHIIKMNEYNVRQNNCPVYYSNLAVAEVFTKNDCPSGYVGTDVIYTIPADKYTSTVSQALVDMQVQNDLDTYGQIYANTNGSCLKLYYNSALSQTFTKEACEVGYKGSEVTYSIPAGRYTSTIDQADADRQAQEEMDANGQAYANMPGNGTCIPDYDADWIGTGQEECRSGGHRWYFVKDENPNSATYNQTKWADGGLDPSCPGPRIIYGTLDYENRIETTTDVYQDEIIRFWADAAHTIPYSVTNLNITYAINSYDSYYGTNETLYHNIVCNGSEVVLGTGLLVYHNYFQDYELNVSYYLTTNSFQVP